MLIRCKAKAALFSHTKIGSANECWLWAGSKNPRYGRTSVNGQPWLTHRLSYEIYRGKIPRGYAVHHNCHNKLCCNPGHLRAIPQRENVKIAAKRGAYRGERNRNNKLKVSQIVSIKVLREVKKLTIKQISEEMGLPLSTVNDVTRGRTWSFVTL